MMMYNFFGLITKRSIIAVINLEKQRFKELVYKKYLYIKNYRYVDK